MSTSIANNNTVTHDLAATTNTAGRTNSSVGSTSTTSLGSTFLTLLTQELQNQDPTAPMDSTQMVAQMISLNQLSQLTSINQTLTTQLGGPITATTASTGLHAG